MANWQELRESYPHQWLLVEAFGAYTQGGERIIPNLELVAEFGQDWKNAWARYKALHHADHNREYYILHTDRPELSIGVIDAFGRIIES